MFRHLILLNDNISLPPRLVVHEVSSGKRKERVEKGLELVDGEDRTDEEDLASTWGVRILNPGDGRLRNLPLLHDER